MEAYNPKYSLMSNVMYSIAANWKDSPPTVIWAAIGVIVQTATPFVGILMPKLVIDCLISKVSAQEFLLTVGTAAALIVVLAFLSQHTTYYIDNHFGMLGSNRTATEAALKYIDRDYELLTDPDVLKLDHKASRAMEGNNSAANNMPRYIARLLIQILGFLLYGSVIFSVHPAILPFILLSALISSLMLRRANKYEEKTREDVSKTESKLGYIVHLLFDGALAKDLRLYSMLGWVRENKNALLKTRGEQVNGRLQRSFEASLAEAFMILLRDGAAYALLVYLLLKGDVTLGDFTLIFAAIGAFAGWLHGIIEQSSEVKRASVQIGDYRAFINIPDRMNRGAGPAVRYDTAPEIVLDNVSYTYPKAENDESEPQPALSDISLTIRAGERLAVVGVNGAGKSTFVKLICGLYRPTTGTITLGGINIAEYNRDEYYTLFSAVFQEIYEMSTSIACNISQKPDAETNRARVAKCLELSGLSDKVNSLPKGMDTLLLRSLEPEATELSGGERQKLALARALYKDAPVIILDEPTAALDPIAEDETYRRYAELSEGKTSVYISHRLASTRFCDRIIMLDGGKIIETGTHAQLLERGGKYAEMFNVQASYYRTEGGDSDGK